MLNYTEYMKSSNVVMSLQFKQSNPIVNDPAIDDQMCLKKPHVPLEYIERCDSEPALPKTIDPVVRNSPKGSKVMAHASFHF